MPRNATIGRRGFHWLPREDPAIHNIKINGETITDDVIDAEFEKGACPEVGEFFVKLINADGIYSTRYSKGQLVQLFIDFVDGTTKRFEGKIEKLFNQRSVSMGYVMSVEGNHLTNELVGTKVIESFPKTKTYTEICTVLDDTYLIDQLSGYTLTCTLTATDLPDINWEEKSLWDCIFDLTKLGSGEAYVTESKEIILRDRGSNLTLAEAFVWDDTLIDVGGLGTQSVTTKNKIKVYGDDGTGIPILYTANNEISQNALTALKEEIISDSSIKTVEQATELGEAEKTFIDDADQLEGEPEGFLLPSLNPTDLFYVTEPNMQINQQAYAYKVRHKLPIERTKVAVGSLSKMPQIFKKRFEKELALTTIRNPFKMTGSWNLTFDSESEISTSDSNVVISEGKIKLVSGTEGRFTATIKLSSNISQVHPLVVGSNTKDFRLELSTNGGVDYKTLTIDALNDITEGKSLSIRGTFSNINAEIDSIGILFNI